MNYFSTIVLSGNMRDTGKSFDKGVTPGKHAKGAGQGCAHGDRIHEFEGMGTSLR